MIWVEDGHFFSWRSLKSQLIKKVKVLKINKKVIKNIRITIGDKIRFNSDMGENGEIRKRDQDTCVNTTDKTSEKTI